MVLEGPPLPVLKAVVGDDDNLEDEEEDDGRA